MTEIRAGNEEAVIALIMTHLENLTVFRLGSAMWLYAHDLLTTIKYMNRSKTTKALSRLTTLHLFDRQGWVHGSDWLETLSALPSVKTVNVSSLSSCELDDDYDLHLECRLPPASSNITTLVFDSCAMNPKWLFQYLASIKTLKTFSYGGLDGEGYQFEPFWIVSGLLASARYSL